MSLHTSLAPKMQSYAPQNGIMIGENLTAKLPKLNSYTKVRVNDGVETPLIFERPDYKQFEFDWQSYLVNSFPFIKKDGSGIEIDYEYNTLSDSSFYKKVDLLDNNRAAISTAGILGTQGHQITPTKFYGYHV